MSETQKPSLRRHGAMAAVVGLAAAVGVQRVVSGCHTPVQVLAGATVGTSLGYGVWRFVKWLRLHHGSTARKPYGPWGPREDGPWDGPYAEEHARRARERQEQEREEQEREEQEREEQERRAEEEREARERERNKATEGRLRPLPYIPAEYVPT